MLQGQVSKIENCFQKNQLLSKFELKNDFDYDDQVKGLLFDMTLHF